MNSKKIGLKDVVLITLLTAIMIGIQTIVLIPFVANLKFMLWFVGGIDWFLCRIIYCLMIAKAPKTGTAFIFSFIFAIYYFFTNSMIIISAMIAAAGTIQESFEFCICFRDIVYTVNTYGRKERAGDIMAVCYNCKTSVNTSFFFTRNIGKKYRGTA